MNWISVKDQLPEPDKIVLTQGFYFSGSDVSIYELCRFKNGAFEKSISGDPIMYNIDYWMDIPATPNKYCERFCPINEPKKWSEEFINKNNEMLKRLANK